MNKLYLNILTLIAIFSLNGMNSEKKTSIADLLSKRTTPETPSPDSREKKAKASIATNTISHKPSPVLNLLCINTNNELSLLNTASLAVAKYLFTNQIPLNDFRAKTPQDIHPLITNCFTNALVKSITGSTSNSIPGSDIARLLSLGANSNVSCFEKKTKENPFPLQNSLLSAAILAENTEHIQALAAHQRTDLENECFQQIESLDQRLKERPLITAISYRKDPKIIKTLVNNGANVNAESTFYYTKPKKTSVLELFCRNCSRYNKKDHFEIMELLLKRGANPDSVNTNLVQKAYREETDRMLQKYKSTSTNNLFIK